MAGLDLAARKYAALVADPCNGPLVTGPFGDGSGGMISRFESDFLFPTGATQTAGVMVFCPANLTLKYFGAATDGAAGTWLDGNPDSPGATFLSSNAGAFRCLSACLQVYWPGAELDRAGIVSVSNASNNITDLATSVSRLRAQASVVTRMPADHLEIVWRPTEYDTQMADAGAVDAGRATCLVSTFAGVPAGATVRYRMVAVYEWRPRVDVNSGFKEPLIPNSNPSRNSLQDVMNFLDRTGHWVTNASLATGRAFSSLAAGYATARQLVVGTSRLAGALTL